jgi:DNA-damage-inducible protein D
MAGFCNCGLRNSHTLTLASAAYDTGVLTQQDFVLFQDHGYRGLYHSETSADIHLRKGLKKGQRILDYMGTDGLAANLFRASQTEQKLRNDPTITDKERANDAHHKIGAAGATADSLREHHSVARPRAEASCRR